MRYPGLRAGAAIGGKRFLDRWYFCLQGPAFPYNYCMGRVTISSKYQVVIPRDVRDKHLIKPGQEVQVFYYDGRIEIIPLQSMKKMRGIARDIDTAVLREGDRV